MAQQLLNIGAAADDGTGDKLRAGGAKINANFTELYGLIASNTENVALAQQAEIAAEAAREGTEQLENATLEAISGAGGTLNSVYLNAADRTILAGLRTDLGVTAAKLTEGGRSGGFQLVNYADYSTKIDADDPAHGGVRGVFVRSTYDAAKAWVRTEYLVTGKLNALWFGAIGDGVVDDTAAIAAAAAFASATADSTDIVLASGHAFKVTGAIEFGNSVLRGGSLYSSKLQVSGAAAALTFTPAPSYPYGAGIEDLQIIFDASAPPITNSAWKMRVRNCRASGGSIQFYSKNPGLEMEFDNCRFTGASDCSIYTDVNGGGLIVTACDFAPLSWSIRLNGPVKATVADSWFESASGVANAGHIKVDGGAHLISSNNHYALTASSADSHINLPEGKVTSTSDSFAGGHYTFDSATAIGAFPFEVSLVTDVRAQAGTRGFFRSTGTDLWEFVGGYVIQLTGNWFDATYNTLFKHAVANSISIDGVYFRSNGTTVDQYIADAGCRALLNSRISYFFSSTVRIRVIANCHFDAQSANQKAIFSEVATGNYCALALKIDVSKVFSGNSLVAGSTVTLAGGCRIGPNFNFASEAKGTNAIPNGATTVSFAHGLDPGLTVSSSDITITPDGAANPTNDPGMLRVNVTSGVGGQITVSCRNDPGAGGLHFGWKGAVRTA